jgi:hypothetical protein
MASGHMNRVKRPDTWLHRPMLQNVKKVLANPELSTHDPTETLAAKFAVLQGALFPSQCGRLLLGAAHETARVHQACRRRGDSCAGSPSSSAT